MAKSKSKTKKGGEVTVGDVLKGLAAVEASIRLIRKALKSLDPKQPLKVKPELLAAPPPMAREC
jgi:hypothetical protein